MTTCALCGFTPKNPRSLYLSAWTGQWSCVNRPACQKRQARKEQK